MFAHKKNYGRAGYVDDSYRILCIWLLGCLLSLYGSTMHLARLCGGFWTIFFCLVCGPLERKREERKIEKWPSFEHLFLGYTMNLMNDLGLIR